MSKTTHFTSSKDPEDMTKEEANVFRRKYVYPSGQEVTGGLLNFIKVHSSETHHPRGRLLREWTRCAGKLAGGCKSGHLGWFVQLEDGTIKHAMMMLGEECAGADLETEVRMVQSRGIEALRQPEKDCFRGWSD